MLTHKDFRRIALGMKGAVEGAHMGHPDFRVNGKIFATLHEDMKFGMVKLTPEAQARFIQEDGVSFAPENGAWGRAGCTRVRIESVDEDRLGEAMTLAWRKVGAKSKTSTEGLRRQRRRARDPSPRDAKRGRSG